MYARARELCRQMGETAHLLTVLAGIHAFYVIRAELDTALEVAQQLLSIAQGRQDAALLIRAHIAMGESLIYRGEFVGARTHFERANSLYDPIQHRWLAAILGGFDFGAHSLTYVGAILWYLGYPDQAVDRLERALALARKVSNPFSISLALYYMSRIQASRGEGEAALKAADALVLLATEEGLQQWIVYGRFALALGRLADQGQAEAGIGQLREGLASMRPSGARAGRTVFCTAIAEGCGILGRVEDGLAAVTEALAAADENEERFYEAEIHRFKASCCSSRVIPIPRKLRTASSARLRLRVIRAPSRGSCARR